MRSRVLGPNAERNARSTFSRRQARLIRSLGESRRRVLEPGEKVRPGQCRSRGKNKGSEQTCVTRYQTRASGGRCFAMPGSEEADGAEVIVGGAVVQLLVPGRRGAEQCGREECEQDQRAKENPA